MIEILFIFAKLVVLFLLQPTTQVDDKTKPDYVKINSRYVKNLPKVRKTISNEAVEQVREKQEKKLKTYQEKQKGRVPDQ